jgi:hypothetical protein
MTLEFKKHEAELKGLEIIDKHVSKTASRKISTSNFNGVLDTLNFYVFPAAQLQYFSRMIIVSKWPPLY